MTQAEDIDIQGLATDAAQTIAQGRLYDMQHRREDSGYVAAEEYAADLAAMAKDLREHGADPYWSGADQVPDGRRSEYVAALADAIAAIAEEA